MAVWLTAVYGNAHQIKDLLNKESAYRIVFLPRYQALFGKIKLVIYRFLRMRGTTHVHTPVQCQNALFRSV